MSPIQDHLEDVFEELLNTPDKPQIRFSGLDYLTDKLWGLKEQELVVIGARTSQGKTTFSLQICLGAAMAGIPVLVLSLEMTVSAMVKRLFCQYCNIDGDYLRRGKFKNDKLLQEKYTKFSGILKDKKLMLVCGVGYDFHEIIEAIELLQETPKIVVVDYIQAIRTKAGEARDCFNEYIRAFRQLAIDNKFCGILCSQINREAHNSKSNIPYMSQLKSTGCLEEHADKVLLLHWPHFYENDKDKNEFVVYAAKNREGNTGLCNISFNAETGKFFDNKDKLLRGEL